MLQSMTDVHIIQLRMLCSEGGKAIARNNTILEGQFTALETNSMKWR